MEAVTTSDRPDLEAEAREVFRVKWPEFVFHDPISRTHIERVESYFPRFDVYLLDKGHVAAGAWAVPLRWDATTADLPDGYDGALVRSVAGHENGEPPTTLCVMAAAVADGRASKGLAGAALAELRRRAEQAGLAHVIVPVRPTLKHRYPLTPMARYATWTRADGLSIDPWIRTHQRMGATVLGTAHRSMTITGTVAEWETWTGMVFPETGQYVVPDALGLVDIDRDTDTGTYLEDNLWVQHT
jgi:hypothetical protein